MNAITRKKIDKQFLYEKKKMQTKWFLFDVNGSRNSMVIIPFEQKTF